MTIQEILLMDSTVTVQVGASQLQKLIETMKYYKEKADSAQAEIHQLKQHIKELENQTFNIRMISSIEL